MTPTDPVTPVLPDHQLSTGDLVDRYGEELESIPVQLRRFGGRTRFWGAAVTVKCHEDNALLKQVLSTEPTRWARCWVVDGGGSLRSAPGLAPARGRCHGGGMTALQSAVEVADWRRRVWALYAEVRRLAVDDPAAAHTAWRAGRDDLFAHHPASPLTPAGRVGFTGLPVADYDPAWRLELTVTTAEPATIEVTTGTDGDVPFERIGLLRLPDGGTLDLWRLQTYGGGLFLPVRDGLAGRPGGTYGGGRYLLDTVKGADLGAGTDPATLVVDLNFAYNPSCAYDPAWACPLAPPGNVLGVEIDAGERYGLDPA